jgi:membrane protein required for beta-lactamase induction
MLIFKTLHILSMVAMITIFTGGELFYAFAVWRRDVRALATIHRMEKQSRAPIFGIVALFAGIVFGLLTAATGGMDFFKGWLIAAYVLVAVFLINANTIGLKLIRLGDRAIEADEGKRPAEEVAREMAASRAGLFFVLNAVIFAAIIVDMVLKPF